MKKLLFLIWASVFILAACGSSTNSSNVNNNATLPPVPAPYAGRKSPLRAEVATDGAKVFQANCQMCHGPQGHGDGPAGESLDPKPKNLAELQAKASDDFLFWRISEGVPGTAMVSWKQILTEEQIWQIISFIRTLK